MGDHLFHNQKEYGKAQQNTETKAAKSKGRFIKTIIEDFIMQCFVYNDINFFIKVLLVTLRNDVK